MAEADTSNYVKVREENGCLYIGSDSDHAYVEESGWNMFVEARNLRYLEHYDHEDKEDYQIKRSIRGKMSCDKDELGVIGAPSIRLRRGETADIQLCRTRDVWVTQAGYDWTLDVGWYHEFFGVVALPDDVFDRIAGQVIAGRVTSIALTVRRGLYVSYGDSMAPERVTMRRYLKPGIGGRTDRPESALCEVSDIHVRCGEALLEDQHERDTPEVDERRDGLLETLRGVVESNLTLATSMRTPTVSSGNPLIALLLIAVLGVLSYFVFWK